MEAQHDAVVLRKEGHDTPLFLIHEDTGNVTRLLSLAHKLEPGFPIYGVELTDSSLASSVENLAAYHLRTIRTLQPHGPYRLAGYSLGGLLAYEIAYQLLGENEEISFLGLIDTYTPDALKRLRIAHASTAIATRYYVRPINIPVLLFAAADNDVGETSSTGWEAASVCEIRSHSIPGPHRTMIDEPWVGALALQMSVAIRRGSDAAGSATQVAPRSPAFVIKEHRRSDGVVFCFPGAGAQITSFLQLADSLTVPLNVVGMQPRGLDGRQAPHASVEAAVTRHLDTILELDPNGPYRLLGHSFGGWLAFETAGRLASMGKQVLPVLLLDTDPPLAAPPERLPKYDAQTVLARYLRQFEKHARADRNADARKFSFSSEREQLSELAHVMKSANIVSRSTIESPIYRSLCVYHANVNTTYTPKAPLGQKIYLFQTADIDLDDPESISLEEARKRWRVWAPNLEPVFIEGDHMTMLQRPNIDSVAALARTVWVVNS